MIITQSCQQLNFTEGLSAIMLGLLVSEAKAETQHIGTEGLLLAMIDKLLMRISYNRNGNAGC